jgi:hypothetical protein
MEIVPTVFRKAADFLARSMPALLLGAALLFFTIRYVPAFNLSMMDTETVWLPLFYQDIVTEHHPASYWQWSGFNAFFPDLTVFFVLDFIGGAWFAVQGTVIVFFLAWLAACVGLVVALRRRHSLALASFLFLIIIGEITDFSLSRDFGAALQDPIFEPAYHVSISLLGLTCVAFLVDQLQRPSRLGYSFLLLFVYLGVFSNIVFVTSFVIPALVTLAFLACFFAAERRNFARLAVGLVVSAVISFLLVPHFPVPTDSDRYLYLNLHEASNALSCLWTQMGQNHLYYDFLIGLDVFSVLGGVFFLAAFPFYPALKRQSRVTTALIAFGTAAIACNWGAVMLIGRYIDMGENRYLVTALILPLFAIALGAHSLIRWETWMENLLVIMTAVFVFFCALVPPGPSDEYSEVQGNIPILQEIMKKNNITLGVVSYWRSNLYTFLSRGSVTLRSIGDDGSVNNLYTSLWWYGKGRPIHEAPHFRLILDPDKHMADEYGPPDQTTHLPDGEEVWIYSEARSIRYNDYFRLFTTRFTDDGHTLPIRPFEISSETGRREGNSFIAVSGRDAGGYLTRGPRLTLRPGHYRAVYRYAYEAAPTSDKPAAYELWDHGVDKDEIIDTAKIEYTDALPHDLSRPFIARNPSDSYEMLIRYGGSGTLRVDALEVTCMEP